MGVHGEGVHAANIGVRYVAYFQAIFPMSFRWTQIKVKPPHLLARATTAAVPDALATMYYHSTCSSYT